MGQTLALERPSGLGANPLFEDLFKSIAKRLTEEAAPQVSQAIAEERARIADAILGGLPFVAGGAALSILVSGLVPFTALKVAGYLASAGLGGFGVWTALSALKEVPEAPTAAPVPSGIKQYIDEAVQSMVDEAEPRARSILDEQREKLVSAFKAGLPFLGGAGALAVATALLVPDIRALKMAGYLLSIGAGTAGLWIALDRFKS